MNLAAKFLCIGLTAGIISAAPVTKSGHFTSDDQVYEYTFNLSGSSNVDLYTTSYASGGFVPVLTLFDGAGNFVATDGGSASCSDGRKMSSSTQMCDDAFLFESLVKGKYSVTLTEFDNFANGPKLSDGFFEEGQGNFTEQSCLGASKPFQETDLAPCAQRSSAYSLTIDSVATPEPNTIWLLLAACVPVIFAGRKLSRQSA